MLVFNFFFGMFYLVLMEAQDVAPKVQTESFTGCKRRKYLWRASQDVSARSTTNTDGELAGCSAGSD